MPGCNYSKEDPLKKVAGETIRANEALRIYVDLGPKRSIINVVQLWGKNKSRTTKTTLYDWSRKFAWKERAAAWIDLQAKKLENRVIEEKATWVTKALDKYDEIIGEAMDAWEKSKKDREKTVVTAKSVEAATEKRKAKAKPGQVVRTVETGAGDPRYLSVAIDAIRDARKLLGADQPPPVQRIKNELEGGEGLAGAIAAVLMPKVTDDSQTEN